MRAEAQEKRQPFRVRSPWRDRGDGDPALPHVIRLRAPQDGAVTIADKVQGEVTVQNAELDDFILLRSDGTQTHLDRKSVEAGKSVSVRVDIGGRRLINKQHINKK